MPKISQAHRDRQAAHIQAAAERCFALTGFHGTSMGQIIAEADMSSSTVYRYYPEGKQSLIRAVSASRIDPLLAQIDSLASQPVLPAVHTVFVDAMRTLGLRNDAQPDDLTERETIDLYARLAVNAWTELPRDPQIRDMIVGNYASIGSSLTDLIRRWQNAGMISTKLSAKQIGTLVQHSAFGLIVEQVVTGHSDIPAAGQTLEELLK